MSLIDKLCYTSKLRYTNAGEKVFFSLSSLCFCIISRSVLVALIVPFCIILSYHEKKAVFLPAAIGN